MEPSEKILENLDPVCGMAVDPATAKFESEFDGERYYFCSKSCKDRFDREPERYVREEESE